MKKFIVKNKYALLFLFFILLAAVIERSNISFENTEPDVHTFTTKLIDKELKADEVIDSLYNNTTNNNLAQWVNTNTAKLDFLHRQQGLVFLVYLNSNLAYWTSNSIAVPDTIGGYSGNFTKLGNAYVEVRTKQNDTIAIVGLISIMKSYPYENKFLQNGFHSSFYLECPHSLEIDTKESENAIFSKENEYLFSLIKEANCHTKAKGRLWLGSVLLAFIFLLLFGRVKFKAVEFSVAQFILFSFTLIGIRIVLQAFNVFKLFSTLQIFEPQHFAYSDVFPSLGDLLLTIGLATYLIFVFYTKVKIKPLTSYSTKGQYTIMAIWMAVFILYGAAAHTIFTHLIVDSSFQFEAFDVLNLSIFSFIGYFILLMLFIGLLLLIDKTCQQIRGGVKPWAVLNAILGTGLLLVLVNVVLKNYELIVPIGFLFFVIFYWVYIRLLNVLRLAWVIVLIAIFSAFSTKFVREVNFNKRIEESKVIAVSLAREQDPVAEVIIGEVIDDLKSDSTVQSYLENEWFNFNQMVEYLKRTYFRGYLSRYNFQLTICNDKDSVLLDNDKQYWSPCYGFFNNLLRTYGVETNVTGLYYLTDVSGGLDYFMRVPINLSNNWRDVNLFFELSSRPNVEVLGYPELLLERPVGLQYSYSAASYAKYKKNQLILRSGDFPYALERDVYELTENEFAFFQAEEFDHVLYNSKTGQTVLVSFPTIKFYNVIISFTYIFFFFLLQIVVLLLIGNRFTRIIDFHFSIKNKIVFSMILILLISLFFVGGGTIMYTYNRFEKSQIDILSEKIQSVLVELEHKISGYYDIRDIQPDYINNLLVKFSNVFYTDINIYDIEGNLVSTSRKEIFERNLTGKKINAIAFRELVLNKKARIVHKEYIGKMEYYSAYIPLINSENKLMAYINLPYFSKEILLRKELLRVVVAVINIYAFLLVLSIFVAVYISNLVTEPLRMVQQRLQNIDLSRKNELIEYHRNDEIGELVVEYNRMLGELDKSALLLAKSERESAWREMARQIAHEINNPLTPMKLSIQLLNKSWENKDSDFDERFQRLTKTLIEQIDSLSSIATAFSQFAAMPIARSEKVNVIERINRSVELFNECSFATLEMNLPLQTEVFVSADNERMLQVFNNLLKNAIQAIPAGKQGEVVINLTQTDESVVVEIKDNGTGISPEMENQLFQPNFTTKTSGTGLGLAIVKNIVEEFGGAIWFKSEPGKGSSFFVSMPVYKDFEGEV